MEKFTITVLLLFLIFDEATCQLSDFDGDNTLYEDSDFFPKEDKQWLDRLNATNDTISPPYTTEPNMRSCAGPDNKCKCLFTGNWDLAEEYRQLKLLRKKADDLTDRINELDVGLLRDSMNTIQERVLALKEKVYTQKVSLSVRSLFDIKKSVDILSNLVDQLDLNSTSDAVINLLKDELHGLNDMIDDLWSSHPTLDLSELNKKIKELEARLSNCRENYNISYFRGDTMPVNMEYDGWCEDYELAGVGDAVAHRYVSHSYWAKGNFMKDSYPQTEANRSMIFVRNYIGDGNHNIYYHRYKNYTDFIAGRNENILNRITRGDGYTVYKGAIYDHTRDNKLNRYVVSSRSLTSVGFSPSAIKYLKQVSDTYADIKADETGLYVLFVHSSTNSDRLIIGQFDPNDLREKKFWRTNRHKTSVCAAFMLCGKLYTIDNCWSRVPPSNSNKQYVYDTLTGKEDHIPLHISSKFGFIHQIGYNSRERVLFAWDNGHMVTYPIIWKPKQSAARK